MTQLVVLAGGLGTRLQSVVSDVPKPMAPIQGRPFLAYILQMAKEAGIEDVLLLTGHKKECIQTYFGDGSGFGAHITYAEEPCPLGTGGALFNAWQYLKDEFILLNGDTFFDIDFGLLASFSRANRYPGLVALRYSDEVTRYGFVEIGNHFQVTHFTEKGVLPPERIDGYINGGVYYFTKSSLQAEYLSWSEKPLSSISLESVIFPRLVEQGQLFGLPMPGKFIDIGIPESYAAAQAIIPEWLERLRTPALFLDRDGVLIEDTHYVHGTNLTFNEAAYDWVRQANHLGHPVVVTTNQAGIAKSYFTESDMHHTHDYIHQHYQQLGLAIDAFFYCPYHPEGALEAYRKISLQRKPHPGMILQASEQFRIDIKASLMVGDNPTVDAIQLPYLSCRLIDSFKAVKPATISLTPC